MAKKLLLIENDKNVLACSRMLFQHYGFDVDCSETVESAQALIKKTKYAVAVAELCLAASNEKDGFNMLDYIRKNSPETKVIVVTYLCDSKVKRKALEYDIHGYFEKPVSFDKILKLIDTL